MRVITGELELSVTMTILPPLQRVLFILYKPSFKDIEQKPNSDIN